MGELKLMSCTVPKRGELPLDLTKVKEYQSQLPDWEVDQGGGIDKLVKDFRFPDFEQALRFTNRIGEQAEAQDHHPAILTEWGKVKITWWTHAVKGLHMNDLIMAAKTDQIYSE
jgi:4a-hydroxytetrahydrobiopterin dehydratase